MTTAFRVLVLGGYGVFGARLTRLLAREEGFEVVVAGRRRDRADAFCAEVAGEAGKSAVLPAAISSTDALRSWLDANPVDLVANCVGPYQRLDYAIAETAIAARAHYLDLADGREFVAGFARLDPAARDAGVLAVSGASTLPAISSAAVDRLAEDFEAIDTIESAIAPGMKMPRGLAVVRAILGYAGRPVRVLRDGIWTTGYGWQDLRTRVLGVGSRSTGPRRLGLCDVPDLALFPERYPGVRTVTFRAGIELAWIHLTLWCLSWLVRLRLLPGLEPTAGLMKRVADICEPLGSDRGGMYVTVGGRDSDGKAVSKTWSLLADDGHGPWIPVLPALIVARKLRDGAIGRRGAAPCMDLFDLEEFEAETARFSIWTERRDGASAAPALLPSILGDGFASLPDVVRKVHVGTSSSELKGIAEVDRGQDLAARLICEMAGLPRSGTCDALRVTMSSRDGREVWRRDFAGRRFRSRLRRASAGDTPVLEERVGPLTFVVILTATADALTWSPASVRLAGVKLPRALAPSFTAKAEERNGDYAFDIDVSLPGGRRLIRYRGTLEIAGPPFTSTAG